MNTLVSGVSLVHVLSAFVRLLSQFVELVTIIDIVLLHILYMFYKNDSMSIVQYNFLIKDERHAVCGGIKITRLSSMVSSLRYLKDMRYSYAITKTRKNQPPY